MSKHLTWKLQEYLESRNLTRYRLMAELGDGKGRVAYDWKELPKRLDTEALERVLNALEKLTGEPVELTDVLKYEAIPEPMDAETRAWLEADLAPPLEPYDFGGEDPETLGEPLRYEAGRGWNRGG
jgi:hypothetical protein